MSRNSKGGTKNRPALQVWSLAQARAVLPYLTSVMGSLREHTLEAQTQHHRARKLATRPGRANRGTLLALEEAKRDARQAEDRFHEALNELQSLDIYCLDPASGLALIPFVHDKQLAWFVFDLFDSRPLRFWRYHSDSMEMRRSLSEIKNVSADEGTWLA
jgi:hypothetical protein